MLRTEKLNTEYTDILNVKNNIYGFCEIAIRL